MGTLPKAPQVAAGSLCRFSRCIPGEHKRALGSTGAVCHAPTGNGACGFLVSLLLFLAVLETGTQHLELPWQVLYH